MAEYIEREAVREILERYQAAPHIKQKTHFSIGMLAAIIGCIELVGNVPAADVVPVVHGRWEHIDAYLLDMWRCTACGEEWTFSYDPTDADTKVNYCPECGARMDGDTDG